jgi:superoxide dismutase
MDYGSGAAAYVDAFMAAVSWRNANDVFAGITPS